MFLVTNVVILLFLSAIKSIVYNEFVGILWDIIISNRNQISYGGKFLDLPFHYKPVDKEWCREKCTSLGFTYKEPNMNQKLTPNMIPVDIFFNNRLLYHVLSELICRNYRFYFSIYRNTVENLITNEEIKRFINNDSWFENVLKQRVQNERSSFNSNIRDLEIFAAAHYLDVCIYVFKDKLNLWMYFRKGWPNYNEVNMENEKCIYLYENNHHIGVVTNVNNP
ncbi:uncharacterized protein LOC126901530 isoform X2 [Daktulosphaira vitifoliae]|uniref:uncharacterized protein LOC126901530 isoform X1 n=1 Tax=Daktulosphaira vitifoliae TaxID=58002 RepID=UPI0021A9D2D8|nr:uncharacterized protein LOC126901530 isoform X1 [Daktulosphaira vitifoliae]XP_050533987.1 uncharacterized protein LOC126901530 isoform X2 [Daktulosphaira vitifoliae]